MSERWSFAKASAGGEAKHWLHLLVACTNQEKVQGVFSRNHYLSALTGSGTVLVATGCGRPASTCEAHLSLHFFLLELVSAAPFTNTNERIA